MIHSRANGLFNAFVVVLALILALTYWSYLSLLRLVYFGDETLNLGRYGYYWFIATMGLLTQLFWNEQSVVLSATDFFRSARQALSQTAYVAGALLLTLTLVKDADISRLFFFTFLPVLCVVLLVGNLWVPRLLARIFFQRHRESRVLVIGSPASVRRLDPWLKSVTTYGLRVTGVLTLVPEKIGKTLGFPILGEVESLPAALSDGSIHTVILLEIPESRNVLHFILDATEQRGVRLITLNPLSDLFRHSIRYVSHLGVDFIALRGEPLEDPVARTAKRTVDLVVSLLVIATILPPLALAVFLMQRRQAPGPLFFRQPRTGLRGERFSIYKFRTMRTDNPDESLQAGEEDVRIFPFGRFLRKTSLDEFPQFLNVLRGEMSVVGPRPHMPEHDMLFAKAMASYHVRSTIKPGVTGLAQVRGFRGEAKTPKDIQSRVECDIEYIEEWSFTMDFYIILKTAFQVLRPPKTAY